MAIALGKVLLATSAVVVPVSIFTVTTFRESLFGKRLTEEIKKLQTRCFVIPTKASNNSQAKLLVCNPNNPDGSSTSEHLLYNHKGDQKTFKTIEIKKRGEQLKISLEDSTSLTGAPKEEVTLRINQDTWKEIKADEKTNLQTSCNLVIYEESNGGAKWQCSWGTSEKKEMQLTKFQG